MRTRQASKAKQPGGAAGADDQRRICETFSASGSQTRTAVVEAIHAFFVAPKKEADLRLELVAQDDLMRTQPKRTWVRLILAPSPGKVHVVKPGDEQLFVAICRTDLNHLAAVRNVLLSSKNFRVLAMLEVLAMALGNRIVKPEEIYLSATFSTLEWWTGLSDLNMYSFTDAGVLGPQSLVAYISKTGLDSTDHIAAVSARLLKASKKRYYVVSGPFNLAARLCSKD